MSKHRNFTKNYGRSLNGAAIGVSGGTIVGALVSKRRVLGALAGAVLGLISASVVLKATKPAPKEVLRLGWTKNTRRL